MTQLDPPDFVPPALEEELTVLEVEEVPAPQPVRAGGAGGRLEGKVALVTGAEGGIGRAVAVAFAREGADVAAAYLDEHEDVRETRRLVEAEGRRCVTMPGDVGEAQICRDHVREVLHAFGRLDVLVNNAAEQHPRGRVEEVSAEQLERTFRTNVFGAFFLVQAALPHLEAGASIINTASVTAYAGSPDLVDFAASKGAVVALTRSLALALAPRGIRVNGVAPGPVWIPIVAATLELEDVPQFGRDVPLARPGEAAEVAPSYVYLASGDASYVTGQVLHVNGGVIVNG